MPQSTRTPMYPAATRPLEAEVKDRSARRGKWFDHHREIETWVERVRRAKATMGEQKEGRKFFGIAAALAAVTAAAALLWPGQISRTMRSGLVSSKSGKLLVPPVNPLGLGLLSLQGGLFLAGFLVQNHKAKKQKARFDLERFDEWILRPKVTQEDLQEVLLPHYEEPCPYDPTDPNLSIVVGEYFENGDAHKFGTKGLWYKLKIRGMQSGGTVIFGVTGSGKTSSALRPIMRQLFSWQADVAHDPNYDGIEKMAGFVLDPKGSLAPEVLAVLRSSGMDPIMDRKRRAEAEANPGATLPLTPLIYRQVALAAGEAPTGGPIPLPSPEVLDAVRTREGDYLELGYDDGRTERVWITFDAIKEAARAMDPAAVVGQVEDAAGAAPVARKALLVTTTEGARLDLPFGEQPDPPTASVPLLVYRAEATWRTHRALQSVIFFSFIGAERPDATQPKADHWPSHWKMERGVPGTPSGNANQIAGFSELRRVIRNLAPGKERPGEAADAYRFRWLLRESNLWCALRAGQRLREEFDRAAILNDTMARIAQASAKNPTHNDDHRAVWDGIRRQMEVFFAPLGTLLGPQAVGPETLRRDLVCSAPLQDFIQGVRAQLDPGFLQRVDQGRLEDLSIPVSDRPRPHPKDAATAKAMGPRFAEDDPLVELVHRATRLRRLEHGLETRLRAWSRGAGRDALRAFEARLDRVLDVHVQNLSATIEEHLGVPAPQARIRSYMEGVLTAIRLVQGDAPRVLARLLAAEPTFRYEGRENLLGERFGNYSPGTFEDTNEAATTCVGVSGYLACEDLDTPAAQSGYTQRVVDRFASWMVGPGRQRHPRLQAPALEQLFRVEVLLQTLDAGDLGGPAEALRPYLKKAITTLHLEASIGLADAWEDGVAETVGSGAVQELLTEGRPVMREVLSLISLLSPQVRGARPGFPKRDANGAKEGVSLTWLPLVFDDRNRVGDDLALGSFWRGMAGSEDVTPWVAAQWNPHWSRLWWRGLGYALGPVGQADKGTELRQAVAMLGNYHQAALDAFVEYVAPNVAWRTNGIYCYNPLYAPDIDLTNLAQLFNTTAFEAQSNGNDKSDPFWQNASLGVVKMLMLLLDIVDGYVTFPKIDELVTKPDSLASYIERIRRWLGDRNGTPAELENMAAIIKWYDGEWNTAASSKSETKDNIIKSLSVVTAVFKDPKYQVVFAPPEADQSFPSWTWIFKEGKVVVANLPTERYEGVAKAILPLMNRTFQKAVMMRDGQRQFRDALLAAARPRIEAAQGQIRELLSLKEANAEQAYLLGIFFPPQAGATRASAVKVNPHTRMPLSAQVEGGSHLLALALGLSGRVPVFSDVWARVTPSCRQQITRGAWFRYLVGKAEAVGLPAWAKAPLDAPSMDLPSQMESQRARWPEQLDALAQRATHGHPEDLAVMAAVVEGDPFGWARETLRAAPCLLLLDHADLQAEGVRSALRREYDRLRTELGIHHKDASDQRPAAALALGPRIESLFQTVLATQWAVEELPNTERPAAYIVDECHFYCSNEDAKYTSVARSAKAMNFYSTQSPNALIAKMDQEPAKQFMDNLVNRMILREADSDAAEACAKFLGGKRRVQVVERNISQNFEDFRADGGGRGKATGGSVSVNVKHEERWVVELNELTSLPAMQAFCSTWDGFKASPPCRVYMKPDFLYVSEEVRDYRRATARRLPQLPPAYPEGTDLYQLTVPRLIQLGVLDPSR